MRNLVFSAILAGTMVAGTMVSAGGAMAQTNPAPVTASPAGTPDAAPPTTATAQTAAADDAPAPSDNDVTCRYEKITGSMFTSRVCRTQRQWKARTQDAHDMMDKASNNSAGQAGGS